MLPLARDELFVGRDEELRLLESSLLASSSHPRVAVHGPGGCGKSALALEFAYRALVGHPKTMVFWVNATSQESVDLAYRDIGVRLPIPGVTDDNADVRSLVKDALSSESLGAWLMIVENVDDPAVLSSTRSTVMSSVPDDYLPKNGKGTILITTRSRKVAEDLAPSQVIQLNSMSNPESRQLFTRRTLDQGPLDDRTTIDELLELLQHLPLAIVLAATFINNNGVTVRQYLSSLKRAGTKIALLGDSVKTASKYREMDETTTKTWWISFHHIRKQDPLAVEYLSYIACIDPVNIPQSLLPKMDSSAQQRRAIKTLARYMFITERRKSVHNGAGERIFDMHRLVHVASAWWLDRQNTLANWVTRAAIRLESLLSLGGHQAKETWIVYLSHASYVANSSESVEDATRAALYYRLGCCQFTLGQFSASENSHRQAVSLRDRTLGRDHPLTCQSLSQLGLSLNSQGKYMEAEAIFRQMLMRTEHVCEHPHTNATLCDLTLMSMGNLGLVLMHQHKYEEAEAMNRQALAEKEMMLGRHPSTLNSMDNLATVLHLQGKHDEAEALYRKALAWREPILGTEHPDTLMSLSNLSTSLQDQGKYEEAEAMSRRTIALQQAVIGPKHPCTLLTMSNLARLLHSQGKYEE